MKSEGTGADTLLLPVHLLCLWAAVVPQFTLTILSIPHMTGNDVEQFTVITKCLL